MVNEEVLGEVQAEGREVLVHQYVGIAPESMH